MEAVMLKDMTTIDYEDKMERELDKLAQKMIVCPRSSEVNSVNEVLPFSHKTPWDCLHYVCNIEINLSCE